MNNCPALQRIDEYRWRIPPEYMPGMRVPGIIFSSGEMIKDVIKDNAPLQVANAAHLPGIVRAAMAMPDIHWGYGLPIGGVVATDIEEGGVVTPGGVGFDINCGVRLLKTNLTEKDVKPRIRQLIDKLFADVPAGVGAEGNLNLSSREEEKILTQGAAWAVKKGYGTPRDLEYSEENGAIALADPSKVSDTAFKRGKNQSGTLGSGNHFLEIQVIDEIYQQQMADVFEIQKGQIMVMLHTGSRGFGHQVCTDYAQNMIKSQAKFNIKMPDKQLACVPVKSPEAESYLGAMRSAANYAWCNRQVITHLTRQVFEKFFGEKEKSLNLELIYDVAHNIAKFEKYNINGKTRLLCVHRKGATRAFPPQHPELPRKYKDIGQPVIVPGDMGRYSYLLTGTMAAEETFYSTSHGAGRLLSRANAIKITRGRAINRELEDKGIIVRWKGRSTLNEEAPEAYKNVSDVVNVMQKAGITEKVARMRPIGVIKG